MNPDQTTIEKTGFQRLGESLYRKGGKIYARLRVNGKATWRSTGTSEPREARAWLKKWRNDEWLLKNGIEPKGVVLQRQRVTVREVVDAYLKAGCPTRKMRPKSPCTVKNEKYFLNPALAYFGNMPAASLSLADCDKYLDWRTSGGSVGEVTVRGQP